MITQIELENVNLNATNFLKWIANHPDKESNYLKCKLKDLEIEVEEEDLIALIGNDGREIFLNYFDYEDVSDFISMDELIENNIIEKPIFVVTADFADDLYATDTCVVGITDDYELAQTIAKDTDGDIDLAQMNKRINIQAGAYIE
jgi:hypothetical protein